VNETRKDFRLSQMSSQLCSQYLVLHAATIQLSDLTRVRPEQEQERTRSGPALLQGIRDYWRGEGQAGRLDTCKRRGLDPNRTG